VLDGSAGSDLLQGGAGVDLLDGGIANDTLLGGAAGTSSRRRKATTPSRATTRHRRFRGSDGLDGGGGQRQLDGQAADAYSPRHWHGQLLAVPARTLWTAAGQRHAARRCGVRPPHRGDGDDQIAGDNGGTDARRGDFLDGGAGTICSTARAATTYW